MTPGQNLTMKLLATASICLVALAAGIMHAPAQTTTQQESGSGTSIFPNIMRQPSGAAVTNFGQINPIVPGGANTSLPGTAPVTDDVDERAGAPRVSAPRLRSAEPGKDPVLEFGERRTGPEQPGASTDGAATVAPSPGTAERSLAETPDLNVQVSGTATVMGGDMLRVAGRMLVLHGADAPETGQVCFSGRSITWKCGDKAQEALRGFADGRYVSCLMKKPLGENAATAVCETNGIGDIGAAMVRSGMAVVPRKFDTRYVGEEATARARSAGVWVGSFDMPWKVRQASR